MNAMFGNTYQTSNGNSNYGNMGFQVAAKKGFPFPQRSESLFGMALYDFDTSAVDVGFPMQTAPVPPMMQTSTQFQPVFHPVDEYKDLSLREILDLSSDDFLGPEDDHFMNTLEPVSFATESSAVRSPQPVSVISCDDDDKKRSRGDYHDDDSAFTDGDDSVGQEHRFRPYQAGQWSEKFQELCEYRERTGHCLVPHTYNENLALARWVKRQRYQYKLMAESKASTMTEERAKALEEIGFIWDSQGAAWGERLGELEEFRKTFLHCNVPSNFAQNPRLATWIKCQRRQYKLYMEGKPSNMTTQRISHLERLGFEWELRSYKKVRHA